MSQIKSFSREANDGHSWDPAADTQGLKLCEKACCPAALRDQPTRVGFCRKGHTRGPAEPARKAQVPLPSRAEGSCTPRRLRCAFGEMLMETAPSSTPPRSPKLKATKTLITLPLSFRGATLLIRTLPTVQAAIASKDPARHEPLGHGQGDHHQLLQLVTTFSAARSRRHGSIGRSAGVANLSKVHGWPRT